ITTSTLWSLPLPSSPAAAIVLTLFPSIVLSLSASFVLRGPSFSLSSPWCTRIIVTAQHRPSHYTAASSSAGSSSGMVLSESVSSSLSATCHRGAPSLPFIAALPEFHEASPS
ncbi:hypothetical protein S83_063261, partial [Arachis hypogaea]